MKKLYYVLTESGWISIRANSLSEATDHAKQTRTYRSFAFSEDFVDDRNRPG